MRLLNAFGAILLAASVAGATDIPLGGVMQGLTKPTTTGITGDTCGSGFAYAIATDGTLSCRLVNLASDVTGTLPIGNGGTGVTTAPDDNVLVGNGTAWQTKALTDCNAADQAVTYDTATNTFGCNTISSALTPPGGADTDIQFNQAGAFGGESALTWDYTNNRFALTGLTTANDNATNMFKLTGTMPASPTSLSGEIIGAAFSIAGAGSASFDNFALNLIYTAGYTGSSPSVAAQFQTSNLGTGTSLNLASDLIPSVNMGVRGNANGPGTGINVGVMGDATGGTASSTAYRIGGYFRSNNNTASTAQPHIGTLSVAANSTEGTDLKNVAAYATLATSLVTGLNSDFAGLFDGGPVGIWNQNALRFYESGGNNFVALRSAASVASDVTWTLPSTDSTGTQTLVSNGSGTLSWASAARSFVNVGGCETAGNDTFGPVVATAPDQCFATESKVQVGAPNAGILRNLYCTVSDAPGSGGDNWVITLRKAGVNQALTCTITNAETTCNDTTHTFSFAQGDLLSVGFDQTGVANTPFILCSAEMIQ